MQQSSQFTRPGALRRASLSQQWLSQLCVCALVSLGFAQVSQAGVVTTHEFARAEQRAERSSDLARLLARSEVAAELARYGVSAEDVLARVENMTDDEILALEGRIGDAVAGGDALAVIGVVFLVLLILEVVGVTDIFKSV